MINRYNKGRAFEYAVKHEYERKGWLCTRSSSSKGLWDLTCLNEATREIRLVQCKTGKKLVGIQKEKIMYLKNRLGGFQYYLTFELREKG